MLFKIFQIFVFFSSIVIICARKSAINPDISLIEWTGELDLDHGVKIKWSGHDPQADWIIFEIKAPTKGYVSLGFSPNGGMKGADIFLGWIDQNGKPQFKDMHALGNEMPIEDKNNNFELLKGEETGGEILMRFRRHWDTCDDEQDWILSNDTVKLIWAYGPEKPKYIEDQGQFQNFTFDYHGETRGVKSIYPTLKSQHLPYPDDENLPPGVQIWDVKMENNRVVKEPTTYFWKIFKFPEESDEKFHAIGFKVLIEKENYPYVHHSAIYECTVPDGGENDRLEEKVFEKYLTHPGGKLSKSTPKEWGRYCTTLIMTHAVGSEGDMYPENIGLAMGGKRGKYFRFEVHYDNPMKKTFIDNTAFRIYYTKELRKYDANMFYLGAKVSPFMVIPQGMSSFRYSSVCGSDCTKHVFPETGIFAFKVQLHGHLASRKIRLRHIRNGVELPPISQDNFFDFNYQQLRIIDPPRNILPGDELFTECFYETKNKTTPTFGALDTSGEMCMALLYYYPKVNLAECKSIPEFHSFIDALGIRGVSGDILKEMKVPYVPEPDQKYDAPDDAYGLENTNADGASSSSAFDFVNIIDDDIDDKTLGKFLANRPWSENGEELGKSVEKKWNDGFHYLFCTGHGRMRNPLKNYIRKMPQFIPYEEPKEDKCFKRRGKFFSPGYASIRKYGNV